MKKKKSAAKIRLEEVQLKVSESTLKVEDRKDILDGNDS